ncbi:hypothetical protein BJ964_006346 [Actinoplanes lobatus]|uniref:Uncharacterized protein n=1 Tax=Actinoplanes lobatus TaxID=113568 RepID=A0A7W7HKJ8_9ACTN|nr:hypothetical protein [Actinoplanes lobatus]
MTRTPRRAHRRRIEDALGRFEQFQLNRTLPEV